MAGNIRSGYPLPWFCKDCRGIGTRPRKCTAIVDPGERFFSYALENGDFYATFPAVATTIVSGSPNHCRRYDLCTGLYIF